LGFDCTNYHIAIDGRICFLTSYFVTILLFNRDFTGKFDIFDLLGPNCTICGCFCWRISAGLKTARWTNNAKTAENSLLHRTGNLIFISGKVYENSGIIIGITGH
jgi:hypothetical protein